MTLIPQKAPGLLLNAVSDDYASAVNCFYPNSFRLLNRRQYQILQAVNGRDDVEALAEQLEIPAGTLHEFLLLLNKTEIIGFGDGFAVPIKPATPKSLNFWVHTTNVCNLGCSYCYISTLNTGKGMTDAVRQQLLYNYWKRLRKKASNISGSGGPGANR